MPGCAAPNCSNHSRHGYKLYRFPADPLRQKSWLINCRRQDWCPTQNDRLCSIHFEESQYETKRADGLRKLKPNSIPTLFNVSNAPKVSRIAKKHSKRAVIVDDCIVPKTKRLATRARMNVFGEDQTFYTLQEMSKAQNLKIKNLEAEIKRLQQEVKAIKDASHAWDLN